MWLNDLFERQVGNVFHTTEYKYLYHITDSHGYAYTIDNNALRGLRQNYVSTTYDPKMNGVYGYSHYDFKFILNGKALVETYGAFNYDHHIRVVGDRSSRHESLNEREIGINTKSIEPFNDYLIGTVLLFDIFSQKAIQWLLYDHPDSKGFISASKSKAPRAIDALYTQVMEWRKPIFIGPELRRPTGKEYSFLKDIFRLHKNGGDFQEAMRELSDKYPIKDHWNVVLDKQMVIRRQKAKDVCKMLNDYYRDRPYEQVDVKAVEGLLLKAMQLLDLNNNITTVVMAALHENGLLHPVTAPVNWGSIFKPLMNGDVEETLQTIKWFGEEDQRARQRYDSDASSRKYRRHYGTEFGF